MARSPLFSPQGGEFTYGKTYYNKYDYDGSDEQGIGIINNNQWFRNYRFILVHFKDSSRFAWDNTYLNSNIAQWFNSVFVPQVYNETYGNDQNGFSKLMSNQTMIMRESSPYTGEFNIIKQWNIKINRTTTSFDVNFKLEPNKDLTMKDPGQVAGNWAPTDDWYKNTYLICICPTSRFDMDPLTFESIKTNTSTYVNEIGCYTMRKYTWYDM